MSEAQLGSSKCYLIKHPVTFDRFEIMKQKIKNALLEKVFCGICLESDEDMSTVNVEFELDALHQKITFKDMIDIVFNNKPILTSEYVCSKCVDKLMSFYMFVANTMFTADVLNIYLEDLSDKVNSCNLQSVEHLSSSKIALILDGKPAEKYFPEKVNIAKENVLQKQDKKSYKCPECSYVISTYKEFLQHKKSHRKSENACKICNKIFKNDEFLTVHYSVHSVIRCKLCYEIMAEVDLSDHLKKQHCESILECPFCKVAFYNKRALDTHVNVSHNNNVRQQCPMCLKRFKGNDVDTHRCRFTCPQCKVIRCRHFEYLMSYRDQKLKGKKAKCLNCDFVTGKRDSFLGHINRVHLKYLPYSCKQCTLKFNSKMNLNCHIHRAHKQTFSCGYCDQQFNNKKELERHIKYCQLIKRDYSCKTCLASFNTYEEIMSHTNFRHSSLYQCQICNKEFSFKSRLKYHIDKVHSGLATDTTDEAGSKHVVKKEKSIRLAPSVCETCGKSFPTLDSLKSHLRSHAPKVPCPECQKLYNPSKLNVHLKLHKAEKDPTFKASLRKRAKIKCPYCDYVTYGHVPLEGHINRYHNKIKPYTCAVCSKEFLGQLHLKRHMQCHNGDRSRTCEICAKVLANRDCFRMHMRLHTGEKPYPCEVCGERFRSSSIMNVHKNRVHAEKGFKCPLCGSKFYTVRELRRHCIKVHWKRKDKKFNFKELEGLKEEHYHLFYDGRTPVMKSESKLS